MQDIKDTIQSLGAPANSIILFDEASPYNLPYNELIEDSLSGVVEVSNHPILYFIDNTNMYVQDNIISSSIKKISCRSDSTVLAVIELGQIKLYPCNAFLELKSRPKIYQQKSAVESRLIKRLIDATLSKDEELFLYGTGRNRKGSLKKHLFDVLDYVGKELNKNETLQDNDELILSLIGRALLTRFVIDRSILTEGTFPKLFAMAKVNNFFRTPKTCAMVNQWLDVNFNGGFLPLPIKDESESGYIDWFNRFDIEVFNYLSLIVSKADINHQLSLPDFVNFKYVPVGLFSEVYEQYASTHINSELRKSAKKESIHYTPRKIAELMLDQSFSSLDTCKKYKAKVLDPACGAGVFLVLSFRKLILEHWRATNRRPDTKKIRKILYEQIEGFDINSTALNLAALSLYLSAIELDPDPLPPESLRFEKDLIGTILHNTRSKDEPWQSHSFILGSLGTNSPQGSKHKYDIVIGNPPWTSFNNSMNMPLTQVVRDVAKGRDADKLNRVVKEHQNPDQAPDLPFVWKSMEWAKPHGVICFTLHARFLFKNTDIAVKSREDLFDALNITGILNATALRKTKVWDNITATFCILFARNEMPKKGSYFRLVSPDWVKIQNELGRMRISYQDAKPIHTSILKQKPWLMKTLFRGTYLDVSIVEKLFNLIRVGTAEYLDNYWLKSVGDHKTGVGFQKLSQSLNKPQDASWFLGQKAKELNAKRVPSSWLINQESTLDPFKDEDLGNVRNRDIYRTPLVVMNKAIKASDPIRARLVLDEKVLAYSEAFYGYSTLGHPFELELAKYLFILLNSDLFLYFQLMTDSRFGVERETIQKTNASNFPIIPFENLTKNQISKLDSLVDTNKSELDFREVNRFCYQLYELDSTDRRTIIDSLDTSLPYKDNCKKACRVLSKEDECSFIDRLNEIINPFEMVCNIVGSIQSWVFIQINSNTIKEYEDIKINNLYQQIAEQNSSTRIFIEGSKSIIVGMINEYRYWTVSRAHLLGLEIIRNYEF